MALPATAEENFFRCVDSQGVVMLTDRPCENLPNGARPVMEKEHFVLPASEQARSQFVNKPPVHVSPKIDVQTLRMARQALELRDKVASAR
ncbi:hypothetical protein ASE26_16505 [Duganella sp. Root198D2]|nr:hypothetical protein ASD07_17255 [Duganella sp. Root336D2]KRC02811.1 hypothetical protein ASE26_16505 [Duganella sp. Root198D2]